MITILTESPELILERLFLSKSAKDDLKSLKTDIGALKNCNNKVSKDINELETQFKKDNDLVNLKKAQRLGAEFSSNIDSSIRALEDIIKIL